MQLHSPLRRAVAAGTSLAAGLALAATMGPSAQAADGAGVPRPDDRENAQSRMDNRPNPLARKQVELRKEALEAVANG